MRLSKQPGGADATLPTVQCFDAWDLGLLAEVEDVGFLVWWKKLKKYEKWTKPVWLKDIKSLHDATHDL